MCDALSGSELRVRGTARIAISALERTGPVHAIFRTGALATGHGDLSIEWRDVYGRIVDQRSLPIELNDKTDIGFDIDLRRTVAIQNELTAHLIFDGMTKRGLKDHRFEEAQIVFVAKPPIHTWWDYAIIMWQNHTAGMFAKLKELGIDGGQYIGRNTTAPECLLKKAIFAGTPKTLRRISIRHIITTIRTGIPVGSSNRSGRRTSKILPAWSRSSAI